MNRKMHNEAQTAVACKEANCSVSQVPALMSPVHKTVRFFLPEVLASSDGSDLRGPMIFLSAKWLATPDRGRENDDLQQRPIPKPWQFSAPSTSMLTGEEQCD